jgi:hypothetical protein
MVMASQPPGFVTIVSTMAHYETPPYRILVAGTSVSKRTTRGQPMLPNPNEQPTISVRTAAAALGIGVTLAYAEARRFVETDGAAGLPAIAIGSRIVCPTSAIRRLCQLDQIEAVPAA